MKYFCNECGTENEAEYKYCKNCGNKLFEEKENNAPETGSTNGGTYFNDNRFVVDTIDGIPSEEMAIFIGKKASDIMPKFTKMAISNSKISWCWPAALLGLFLGPLGAALWFFYRKMYKNAVILSVIGAITTIITSLLTFGTTSSAFQLFADAFFSGDFEAAMNSLANADVPSTILDILAGLITDITDFLTFLLTGLFGYHLYKNHCAEKIHSFKTYQADQRYYRLGLSSIGGVSGGMLAVGIIIMITVENFVSIITAIASMII